MNREAVPALAQAMMSYLDCKCQYFPPMDDDKAITEAFSRARRLAPGEGFVPVLIAVNETLWECLIMNSDPDHDSAEEYGFDPKVAAAYRENQLSQPVPDGKAMLEERIAARREEIAECGMDWNRDVLGDMGGGQANGRFSGIWDFSTRKTCPLILAEIPVKNPWEVFAYLPFGGWNECPDTPELMAAAKYWFEQHGAAPAVVTHDVLEFILPKPVSGGQAMQCALEQYSFCSDIIMQTDGATVGWLADVLRQSAVWFFWWD